MASTLVCASAPRAAELPVARSSRIYLTVDVFCANASHRGTHSGSTSVTTKSSLSTAPATCLWCLALYAFVLPRTSSYGRCHLADGDVGVQADGSRGGRALARGCLFPQPRAHQTAVDPESTTTPSRVLTDGGGPRRRGRRRAAGARSSLAGGDPPPAERPVLSGPQLTLLMRLPWPAIPASLRGPGAGAVDAATRVSRADRSRPAMAPPLSVILSPRSRGGSCSPGATRHHR